MKPRLRLLSLLASLLLAVPARADLVVIAHPRAGVDPLTREQVINIFLGRFRQFPSGIAAEPIDLPPETAEKAAFYQRLVGKDLAEINAYWARLVFSGRTLPPRQAIGVAQMIDLVAGTPGAIGYVDRARADTRVKIVFELETAR